MGRVCETNQAITIAIEITNNPINQNGISFARTKVNLPMGVTLICSMVPVSFSITMFVAEKNPHIIINNIIIRAGIIR